MAERATLGTGTVLLVSFYLFILLLLCQKAFYTRKVSFFHLSIRFICSIPHHLQVVFLFKWEGCSRPTQAPPLLNQFILVLIIIIALLLTGTHCRCEQPGSFVCACSCKPWHELHRLQTEMCMRL